MPRLSNPLQKIGKHYEIVVIGSGYGAGVAASRLARAGRQVCLLEKGKERQPSEYPDNALKMGLETQLDLPGRHLGSDTGLFHLRVNPDISVFQACGLGGTSIINGGVSLRVLPKIYHDERWPEEVRREINDGSNASPYGSFEQYYRLAEDMIKPRTWPENYPRLPKMDAMQEVAAARNLPFARVPIAVTFDGLKNGLNHVGVPQKPCIACGDCAAGCNHSAKNTVLMNYLPDAKNHGAEIYTGIGLHHLERRGDQWLLHCRTTGHTSADIEVTADVVVLGAGTMGTNEILFRSRERGLTLSDHLGTRFSGNGDVVGWSYNTSHEINAFGFGNRSPKNRAPVGPFASSVIDAREEHEFLVIEGTFPGGMVNGIAALLSVLNSQGTDMRGKLSLGETVSSGLRIAKSLINPFSGATKQTQTYLVVNQDRGDGRMFLEKDSLRISWPNIGKDQVFEESRETLMAFTKTLGGTFITQLKGKNKDEQGLLTGHPSGGAYMSDTAETGVANHKGEIYNSTSGADTHKGLYVMDGALIPRCIGVNPLLTISALAERCCSNLAKDRGWTIDYSLPPV